MNVCVQNQLLWPWLGFRDLTRCEQVCTEWRNSLADAHDAWRRATQVSLGKFVHPMLTPDYPLRMCPTASQDIKRFARHVHLLVDSDGLCSWCQTYPARENVLQLCDTCQRCHLVRGTTLSRVTRVPLRGPPKTWRWASQLHFDAVDLESQQRCIEQSDAIQSAGEKTGQTAVRVIACWFMVAVIVSVIAWLTV